MQRRDPLQSKNDERGRKSPKCSLMHREVCYSIRRTTQLLKFYFHKQDALDENVNRTWNDNWSSWKGNFERFLPASFFIRWIYFTIAEVRTKLHGMVLSNNGKKYSQVTWGKSRNQRERVILVGERALQYMVWNHAKKWKEPEFFHSTYFPYSIVPFQWKTRRKRNSVNWVTVEGMRGKRMWNGEWNKNKVDLSLADVLLGARQEDGRLARMTEEWNSSVQIRENQKEREREREISKWKEDGKESDLKQD